MSKKVVKPYSRGGSKKEEVEQMFDNIAGTYDRLNHLLSLNIDRRWRKKAVDYLAPIKPESIIDIATGTGDFAVEAARLHPKQIIGFDLSENMLQVGREKVKALGLENIIQFVKGDSEKMPFKEEQFDAMTVGFGVRNFENLEQGLSEMHRILKTKGRLCILEIAQPQAFPMKQLYAIYFRGILPVIGKMLSKDHRAYTYLPESVAAFPQGEDFVQILKGCGFKNIQYRALSLGSCAMYSCEK